MKKLILGLAVTALLAGCAGPRMTIMTGTSVGLNCTPGNGGTTPPQITVAYKRVELAVIPTSRNGATQGPGGTNDAYSALAGLDFRSGFFFRPTQLQQFISTGFAARSLLANSGFTNAFGK